MYTKKLSPWITKNVNNKVFETETIGEQYNGKDKYLYTCFPHALENEKLIASAMTRTRTRVQNVNFSCWLQKSLNVWFTSACWIPNCFKMIHSTNAFQIYMFRSCQLALYTLTLLHFFTTLYIYMYIWLFEAIIIIIIVVVVVVYVRISLMALRPPKIKYPTGIVSDALWYVHVYISNAV